MPLLSAGVAINQPEEEEAFAALLEPSSCLQNVLIMFIQGDFSCRFVYLAEPSTELCRRAELDLPLFSAQECWILQAPAMDSFSPTAALFHEEHFALYFTMVQFVPWSY